MTVCSWNSKIVTLRLRLHRPKLTPVSLILMVTLLNCIRTWQRQMYGTHVHCCVLSRTRCKATQCIKSSRSSHWTRSMWDAVRAAALVLLVEGSWIHLLSQWQPALLTSTLCHMLEFDNQDYKCGIWNLELMDFISCRNVHCWVYGSVKNILVNENCKINSI